MGKYYQAWRNQLIPHEEIVLVSYDSISATFEGYVYAIYDSLHNFKGWWPFDTTLTQTKFAYSILVGDRNKMVRDTSKPLSISKQHEPTVEPYFSVRPVPTNGNQELLCILPADSKVDVKIINVLGQVVGDVFSGELKQGKNLLQYDMSAFPPGNYVYKFQIQGNFYTLKTMKYE